MEVSELATLTPPTSWRFDVHPRALRAMRTETRRHVPLETTGALYGYWRGNSRVIEVATWAGPKAIHTLSSTYQDKRYYQRWFRRLQKLGLWLMGYWHSHPSQDELLPSTWDLHYLSSMVRDFNGYCVEIIIGRKQARAWWVSEEYAWLVWEKEL